MILTSSIFLLCIKQVLCEECVLDNGSQREINQERKLSRDLLCNYDPTQPPQNTTMVTVRFILKRFTFDSHEEVFTMYNWVIFQWVDDRLKWNPKDYEDISETQTEDYLIWTPKLKHKNKVAYEDFDQISNYTCKLISTGTVVCVIRVLSQSECSAYLANWPYDIQTCTLKFGAYNNYKNNIIFTFNSSRGISMLGAEYGPGWNIIDFDKGENASSETQFYLTFVVERQGECLGTIIIFPTLVLSVLTVTSLFLEDHNERLGIAVLSLALHFYIKIFLNIHIPMHSATAPTVVHFVVTSIFLTTVCIILNFILSYLRQKELATQSWVASVNYFVSKSPFRFLIWRIWEERNLDSATSETKQAAKVWTDFFNVVNSASIVLVIIIYITMYICFMPKPLPVQ